MMGPFTLMDLFFSWPVVQENTLKNPINKPIWFFENSLEAKRASELS